MPTDFSQLVRIIINLINPLLVLLAGLALLAFFWGLAKFIFRVGGDEKAVDEGKRLMVWGIIGLFVMVSFLGIINLLYNDLGFNRRFGIPLLPVKSEQNIDVNAQTPPDFNCADKLKPCPIP